MAGHGKGCEGYYCLKPLNPARVCVFLPFVPVREECAKIISEETRMQNIFISIKMNNEEQDKTEEITIH